MSACDEGIDPLWEIILALRWGEAGNARSCDSSAWGFSEQRGVFATRPDDPHALIRRGDEGWSLTPFGERQPLAPWACLYLRLLRSERPWCVAHLGQSLDGNVATKSGDSYYVTGPENLDHLHRMRALSDVVVVGAQTVRRDNPRLTTRRVPGPDPARAVIDPSLSLPPERSSLTNAEGLTVFVHDARHTLSAPCDGRIEGLPIEADDTGLSPKRILEGLARRGFGLVFVEGGGVTVTRFVLAGVVDYLQIAIAPVFIGGGRRGLAMPAVETMKEVSRIPARSFAMGEDVLFDFNLRNPRRDKQRDPDARP